MYITQQQSFVLICFLLVMTLDVTTSFQSILISCQSKGNSMNQNTPNLLYKKRTPTSSPFTSNQYQQPNNQNLPEQQRTYSRQKPVPRQQYENNDNVYNHKFITPSNNIPRRRMKVLLKNYYTPTLFVQAKKETRKDSASDLFITSGREFNHQTDKLKLLNPIQIQGEDLEGEEKEIIYIEYDENDQIVKEREIGEEEELQQPHFCTCKQTCSVNININTIKDHRERKGEREREGEGNVNHDGKVIMMTSNNGEGNGSKIPSNNGEGNGSKTPSNNGEGNGSKTPNNNGEGNGSKTPSNNGEGNGSKTPNTSEANTPADNIPKIKERMSVSLNEHQKQMIKNIVQKSINFQTSLRNKVEYNENSSNDREENLNSDNSEKKREWEENSKSISTSSLESLNSKSSSDYFLFDYRCALLHISARKALKKGKLGTARNFYKLFLYEWSGDRLDASIAHTYFLWALLEQRAKDFAMARSLFMEATTRFPDHPRLLQGWALMESKCGNIDLAKELILKAVKIDPEFFPLLKWKIFAISEEEMLSSGLLQNDNDNNNNNNSISSETLKADTTKKIWENYSRKKAILCKRSQLPI